MYSSMATVSSGTLVKTPRRSRSVVISRKKRSTMFNQEAAVGVKCMTKRGCLAIDDDTRRVLVKRLTTLESLADCNLRQLDAVLDHLNRTAGCGDEGTAPGFRKTDWSFVFRMPEDRQPLLKKLYRIAQAWGKSKAYLEGIARQMAGATAPLEFCDAERLSAIVAACEVQKRREADRQPRAAAHPPKPAAPAGRRAAPSPAAAPSGGSEAEGGAWGDT
jgi:hypothetical protein